MPMMTNKYLKNSPVMRTLRIRRTAMCHLLTINVDESIILYHHDTIRYDTIQYNTIQYDTIRYDTIQYGLMS